MSTDVCRWSRGTAAGGAVAVLVAESSDDDGRASAEGRGDGAAARRVPLAIDESVQADLSRLSAACGAMAGDVLAGAFLAFVGRYTGDDEVSVDWRHRGQRRAGDVRHGERAQPLESLLGERELHARASVAAGPTR